MIVSGVNLTSLKYQNSSNTKFAAFSSYKLTPLDRDTVSFGKQKKTENTTLSQSEKILLHINLGEIKNIHDLPCAYCGEKMISNREKVILVNKIASEKGQELITTLNNNKKYFRGIKTNVVTNIIQTANKFPNDDISEILQKLAPIYKDELEGAQLQVLRKIDAMYSSSFASNTEKTLLQNILYESTQWVNDESEKNPFKRKAFIAELRQLLNLPIFRNRNAVKRIIAEAEKMPQSFESEAAFIVKYHRRPAKEIALQLLYESTPTIEHIKTQESGGITSPENLAIACAQCNNIRRNNMPLSKFISTYPETENNIKQNLRSILIAAKTINKNKIEKHKQENNNNKNYLAHITALENDNSFKQYVTEVAKTFMRESKGLLKLEEFTNLK